MGWTFSQRGAGVAVPLFSLRSAAGWGVGEIPDLIPAAIWAERMGQRLIQLLPINETNPAEASPYSALSAFAIDPLYIGMARVQDVTRDHRFAPPGRSGRAGPRAPLPRARIRQAKLRGLESSWQTFRREREMASSERSLRFERFIERERHWLEDYALFRVLKEDYGWRGWTEWPDPIRRRESAALAEARRVREERIGFHEYVQWIAAEQWSEVRRVLRPMGIELKGDLPFVIGLDSADAWADPKLFVPGWEVGAPPDEFSSTGQNWGLPLYDWNYLHAEGLRWWRSRIRQAVELYDLFRIDHFVGFFRTYGIPTDSRQSSKFHPEDESQQIAQGESFLRMLHEECGDAIPVAEDLGTVPRFVRRILHEHQVPGYKVMRWEKQPNGDFLDPRSYDPISVATTGTHDTSTLAEWWEELTPEERRSLGHALGITMDRGRADAAFDAALRRSLLRSTYESGSFLAVLPIQDLFGWTERINLPMTASAENWNYQLPFELGPSGEVPPEIEAEGGIIRQLVEAAGRR